MNVGGVFYQALELHERSARYGPNILPQPEGEAVRLGARTTEVLAGEPVSGTVNSQLGLLAGRIRAAMPVAGGVLVGVSIDEDDHVNERGFRDQAFVSAEILGAGRVPQLVFRLYQKGAPRARSVPGGRIARTIYLWATV